MIARLWLSMLLVASAAGAARPASAQDLVADLSNHLIAISTDFTGTEVVLFGALDEPGDIAVVVRGPAEDVVVREKERVLGIWVNTTSVTFLGVPSFYRVASSVPLPQIADESTLRRHGIGLQHLRLAVGESSDLDEAEVSAFHDALIRSRQRDGVFGVGSGQVAFLGGRLFRTRLDFPASVPTGQYIVSVYLIRDGAVVDAQTTPLVVSKIGLGADIYAYAQRQAAAYGLLAIFIAVAAGWLASVVFRRG